MGAYQPCQSCVPCLDHQAALLSSDSSREHVKRLIEDGTLKYKNSDFDAAELERLVREYGPAIKAVHLG